ncbi:MAG TPA: SlyX family protein [Candidatus Ozemobacteraceae bacterium]|nr:SlyX family protein [Candidatus Ozemobacteraceae bacterium]
MSSDGDVSLEQRIIELETKVSFQDRTIEELNEIVTNLQLEMQSLERTLSQIRSKMSPSSMTEADINPANEKPPHY